ncbi:DNA-directed RNA polymerase subunit omega [Paenibacillus ginsengarvi]|uniref:DNA-directed RNA polymerase subunit omega n=1 Tax=Paenibacillus ginsengarvi TaxID=400777 RepID=A0A3B0CUB7_9BACL|nr:DNA-directed RNA polymerase subunit omega [Paenibacillus ginsengarvi]RKN86629.1 DNA-directed RNA polymerase subunit omega [Paenibacillus ginsengarvi]
MLYPSIDLLINKIESKYSLVVAASKRARMLRDGSKTDLKDPTASKYVGVALEEIYGDYIQVENQPKEGLKQA